MECQIGSMQSEYDHHFKFLKSGMKDYFGSGYHMISSAQFNKFSLIKVNDPDRQKFSALFEAMKNNKDYDPRPLELSDSESRAVASFLGLGICDALGASTEFMDFDKTRNIIHNGFEDIVELIKKRVIDARCGEIGFWTDDCSMAVCMGNSLLLNEFAFVPKNIRYLFIMWLRHGLGNGGRKHSIGLGGNISISMREFSHSQQDYCEESNRFNNGNGSLMRLAPIPICFCSNEEEAMKYSGLSSRTTHNGDESKECCRLLALLIVRLINRQSGSDWRQVMDSACKDFKTEVESVKYLAMSEQEPQALYNQQKEWFGKPFRNFNRYLDDRNWNWKHPQFTYSRTRTHHQPHYVGSYCMDALAMALHTVWNHDSFFNVAIFNTNIGGDCDTVGAIAGQIAGAIYGIDEAMLRLYSEMTDFKSKRYEVFLNAYKLHGHRPI